MKTVKLTKKMLAMHPADLLVKLGAVDSEKGRVFPSDVYLSKEDLVTLKQNLKKSAQKLLGKTTSKKAIDYSVGMDWLNYSPNETYEEVLKPGYALVDELNVLKEKQENA